MTDTHHHRAHDHPHDGVVADRDGARTHFMVLEIALREILVAKGIFTADDVRREVEAMEGRNAGTGARIVARAWTDPVYKARLLADAPAAAAELGFEPGPFRILVMENTPRVHNVIVCTLCSCYPRLLLGLPPAWYKSLPYRSRVVREPRAVLAEFGLVLPEDVAVRVHDSTADMRYMVLPMRPPGTDRLGEADLADLVSRDALIGVAQVSSLKVAGP